MTNRLNFPEIEMLGIRIHLVDRAGVLNTIASAVESGTGGTIANVNVHAMNTACRDREYHDILNGSDLVFVDGFGVVLGARMTGSQIGTRLTPADWIDDMFELCAKNQWPVFWLGDTDEVGADFQHELQRRHPDCPFAGRHHGFFNKTGPESDAVVELINASGAKILMVGMSMPIQEKWIWANRDRLSPAVRLALGGLARIYTGHIRRGPPWMTQHGLEWLYRMAMQPGYTWRRYLIGNPLFLIRVILSRLGIKTRCA